MRNFLFLPRKEVERQALVVSTVIVIVVAAVLHKRIAPRADPCLSLSLFSLFLLSLRVYDTYTIRPSVSFR
jgi:hypothetical protein